MTLEDRKQAAKDVVRSIRDATACELCAGGPIEWHHPDHDDGSRVAHMASRGAPIKEILIEIGRSQALCRSCHMEVDGRKARFVAARLARLQKERER